MNRWPRGLANYVREVDFLNLPALARTRLTAVADRPKRRRPYIPRYPDAQNEWYRVPEDHAKTAMVVITTAIPLMLSKVSS